jgi:4-amino-4-deoxy-L-arabinose transferase
MLQRYDTDDIDTRSAGRILIGLAGLFIVLFLLSLFGRPLFIPDEVRYAEIAREMIQHGNWIVPRLDGLLYFEKPPLGHWLNAISLVLFGENEFAVRFASAISAGGTALIGYWLSLRLFSRRLTALLTVFIYLTCFEVQVLGNFSVLDSILTLTLNAGIAAIIMAAITEHVKARNRWMLCGGGILGLAFLAKGFLAFVVPGLVIVAWLAWEKKYSLLLARSWLAVAAAVLVAAPWAVAIHLQQPDFWRYFVMVEHLQRFAAENAQHKAPFYYYLVALPVVAFPWFFLLPASIKGLRGSHDGSAQRSARMLLLLWILLPLGFFSVASGKLITYILPCFLPFSMLLAHGLDPVFSGRLDARRWIRAGMLLVFLIFAIALAALLRNQLADAGVGQFLPWEMWKFYVLALSLGLAAVASLYAAWAGKQARSVLAAGAAMVPLLFSLQFVLPDEVMQHKAPGAFLERVGATLEPGTAVATNGSLLRAVTWHLKRDDVYVIQDKGETAYGLDAADGAGRYLEPLDLARWINENRQERDVLVVCKNPCHPETMEFIPEDAISDSYGNFYSHLIRKLPPPPAPEQE